MEGTVMKDAAAEDIAARLSSLEDLYIPRAVQSTTASSDQRKSILLDLLRRDPAVFLERYGSQLSLDELLAFDALKHDYETQPVEAETLANGLIDYEQLVEYTKKGDFIELTSSWSPEVSSFRNGKGNPWEELSEALSAKLSEAKKGSSSGGS
ncbi:hypothetical protein F2Q69_00025066 [Brassica cretica]|uniref:Uncharacterized protein n=1 Tax=Brassica cretica TaxID=69181 RepID=A0A8S9QNY4_BRACR|nr:hypothetical protein F2Q69_00025066 [Brassica cretica]